MGILEAMEGTGTLIDMEEHERLDRLMGMRHAIALIRGEWEESDTTIAGILKLLEEAL